MVTSVCNVQGVVRQPDQKISQVQGIPRATDLDSALKAIQAIVNNLSSQQTISPGNFTEDTSRRTSQTVRVYNPTDHSQYVDVEQITGLTFVDQNTGRTLVWKF